MKILITATDSMAIQFLIPHIRFLTDGGHKITLACSEVKGRTEELKSKLPEAVEFIKVDLKRNPFRFSNLKGLKQLKKIINGGDYDIVWTNEPVMGVMTRLAAKKKRKSGLTVVYMCHGFHFFKGGPKSGWLIWYPVEKFMTRYTDSLITVNGADYDFALKKFRRCKVFKISGIGINTERFDGVVYDENFRSRNGISESDIVLITVAELNKNKNQKTIIDAMNALKDKRYHYVMCGIGDEKDNLIRLAESYGLKDNVHFTGYVNNVPEILKAADIFVFPSRREGFGLAVIEAMLAGLPVIVSSSVRGGKDFLIENKTGFIANADDYKAFADKIELLSNDESLRKQIGEFNAGFATEFDVKKISKDIENILTEVVG